MNAPIKGVSAKADRAATPDGAEPVPVSGIAGIPDADNLAIWREVEKTDPAHTKKVNQRGGFTAISAMYQVLRATETFGPVGEGWGFDAQPPIFHDNLVIVPVTLWHGDRSNTFGPIYGGAEWKSNKGFLDSDAPKKATTDALTKALSHLGFNADVFLGRFDDNKYVEAVAREFAEGASDGEPDKAHPKAARGLDGPHTSKAALFKAYNTLQADVVRCGDDETLTALLATEESKATIGQCERDAPHYLHGGDPAPADFEPLFARIKRMRDEFQLENVT